VVRRDGEFRVYDVAGARPQRRWFWCRLRLDPVLEDLLAAGSDRHRRWLLCWRQAAPAVRHRLQRRPVRLARLADALAYLPLGGIEKTFGQRRRAW
jgi:hypothetical protein